MDKSWLLLLLLIEVCGCLLAEKLPTQNFGGITSNDQRSVIHHRQQPLPRPGIRITDPNAVADIIGTPASSSRSLRKAENGNPPPYLLQPSLPTVSSFHTTTFRVLNDNNKNQFNSNSNFNVRHVSNSQNQNFISSAHRNNNNNNNNNNEFTNFNGQTKAFNNGFQNPNNQVSNFYQQYINNNENEIIQNSGNRFPFNFDDNQGLKGNLQFNLASHEDVHTDTDALNGVSFLSNDGINNFGGTGVILPEPEVTQLSPKETIIVDGGNSNSNNFGLPKISPAIELHQVRQPQQFTVIRDNDDKDSFENFVSQAGTFGLPPVKSENDITANNAFSQQLFTIKNDDDDDNDNSFENFGFQSGGFLGPIQPPIQGNRNSLVVPAPVPGPIPTLVQGNSGSFVEANPTSGQGGSFVVSKQSNSAPVQSNSGSFVESKGSNLTPVQSNSGSLVGSKELSSAPVQSNSGSFTQSKESIPAPVQGNSGSFTQSKESLPAPGQGNSGSFTQSNSFPIHVNKDSSAEKTSITVTEQIKPVEDNLKTESSNSRNQFGIPLPATITDGSKERQDKIKVDSVVNALTSISSGKTENIDHTLGGMTIGELLNGINGKNGIVVLPASKANALNLPNISNKISIRETSDEQIVVATSPSVSTSSTTTEAPVTRRRSNRRSTTRPPDHLRRSLSDILYAKGQWFGTLLGGVIDYGRIAYDSFNKNLGKGSRESYA